MSLQTTSVTETNTDKELQHMQCIVQWKHPRQMMRLLFRDTVAKPAPERLNQSGL